MSGVFLQKILDPLIVYFQVGDLSSVAGSLRGSGKHAVKHRLADAWYESPKKNIFYKNDNVHKREAQSIRQTDRH